MTDDGNFGLSRRKVLGSIGTIGVAAGGIGATTWAGYTDDEIKELNTHAGSLDLKMAERKWGNYQNGPVTMKIGQISPGDTVGHCEWLKNVGQTDGACLSMKIANVKSDEGQSEYNSSDVYNPDAETDTKHSNGGELDDQIEVGGTLKDENGNVLGHVPRMPFHDLMNGTATILGDGGVLLKKNGGNRVQLCLDFHFPHRKDNNEAMKDTLTFDLKFKLQQKCSVVERGTGFVKESPETNQSAGYGTGGENFNGDGSKTGYARARYGDSGGSGTWELAVGNDDNVDDQGQYNWTSGEKVPFKFEYGGFGTDEATFTLDGNSVSTTLDDNLDGRIGLQAKADEATVEVSDASLYLTGSNKKLVSNIDLTASNDGTGRAIEYLVANTSNELGGGFVLKGHVTVTTQGDFDGGDEDAALDVVLE
jgi:hypothetical protein